MPAGSVLMLLPDMLAGVGSYDSILYDSGLFLRLYPVCRWESVLTILSCMPELGRTRFVPIFAWAPHHESPSLFAQMGPRRLRRHCRAIAAIFSVQPLEVLQGKRHWLFFSQPDLRNDTETDSILVTISLHALLILLPASASSCSFVTCGFRDSAFLHAVLW